MAETKFKTRFVKSQTPVLLLYSIVDSPRVWGPKAGQGGYLLCHSHLEQPSALSLLVRECQSECEKAGDRDWMPALSLPSDKAYLE